MLSADSAVRREQLTIAGVVTAYFIVSISLVFVNKMLMDKRTSMEAPLFMTWFQCLVTVGICWALGQVGERAPAGSWFKQFPKFSYRIGTAVKLLPLSAIFVGMITFNNLCLKYVEVSFYNVARSLTIVFNVILTYLMLGQSTSLRTIGCLAIVVAGFFVGSESEVNFSWVGTIFGITSSIFVSLNSIQTKKAMAMVDGNEWALSGYNNMNALLMFLPIILVTDERDVIMDNLALLTSSYYWFLMIVGGIFGFLIGIVTIMQIKATSPLTHNISGTAKACVQTVLALFIWQNPTNFANLLGVMMVLAGSLLYSYVKGREMEAAEAEKRSKAAHAALSTATAPSPSSSIGGGLADKAASEIK